MNYSGLITNIVSRLNAINPPAPSPPVLKAEVLADNNDRYKLGYKLPYLAVACLGISYGDKLFLGSTDQYETLEFGIEVTCNSFTLLLDTMDKIRRVLIGYRVEAAPNFITEPLQWQAEDYNREAEKSVFMGSLRLKARFITCQPPTTNPVVTQVNYKNI